VLDVPKLPVNSDSFFGFSVFQYQILKEAMRTEITKLTATYFIGKSGLFDEI